MRLTLQAPISIVFSISAIFSENPLMSNTWRNAARTLRGNMPPVSEFSMLASGFYAMRTKIIDLSPANAEKTLVKTRSVVLLLILFFPKFSVFAMWMLPDVEKVPIDRVITNLESKIQKNTNDLASLYALARIHSMAYAKQTFEIEMEKTTRMPYFGQFVYPALPPLEVNAVTSKTTAAQNHLTNAIALYERSVHVGSTNAVCWLGLGWCLKEAGQKEQAIAALRRAVPLFWDTEKKSEIYYLSLTEETIKYLLPLLDREKDKSEIKKLEGLRFDLSHKGRSVTPIVVPLSDAACPSSFIDHAASVAFDLDGSGIPTRWEWITPEAAWLVYDSDGSGRITSGLQLFGSATFWLFWENGYQALETLDDNHNGQIDGPELEHLALWRDANSNAISEPGEVLPVTAYGISAISTSHTETNGIAMNPCGVCYLNNSSRPTFDIVLRSQPKDQER
jgi:hypothetical protein